MSFAVQLEDPELSCSGFPLFFLRSCVSKWSHMDADTAVLEGIFFLQGVFILLLHLGKLRHWVVSWSVRTSAAGQGATSFPSLFLTSVPLNFTGRCEAAPFVSSWLRNRHCIFPLLPYCFPTVGSSWAILFSAKFPQPFWPQLWLSTKNPSYCRAMHLTATQSSTHPQPIAKPVSRGLYASAKNDNY